MKGRKRLPWIKLWFEMLGDPKMTRLTLAERGCWHEILLLAGQSPVRGKLMLTETEPMTLDDIARALSLTPDEYPVLESCVNKLIKLDSLRWNEHNCLEVVHFIERQDKYPSDFEHHQQKSPDKLLNNSQITPTTVPNNSEITPKKLRKEEEGRGEGQKEDLASPHLRSEKSTGEPVGQAEKGLFEKHLDEIKAAPNHKELIAKLGELFRVCTGRSPPYPRLGKVLQRANYDGGYVAKLLWTASANRPAGDLLSYVEAILKEAHRGRVGKNGGIPGNRPAGAFDDLEAEPP